MTSKEKRKWAKKLKKFWKERWYWADAFRQQEMWIESKMKKELGEDLEFFYVDGECVGIGHKDYLRREGHSKNYFPLIHDSELEGV